MENEAGSIAGLNNETIRYYVKQINQKRLAERVIIRLVEQGMNRDVYIQRFMV